MDAKLYDIFSNPPNHLVGNKPRLGLYYEPGYPKLSPAAEKALVKGSFFKDEETKAIGGKLRVRDDPKVKRTKTGMVDIAFTMIGDQGPVVLFLHGVPTNRVQYYPIMNLMRSFCRCVCIDMLGMGESQVDRNTVVALNKGSKNKLGGHSKSGAPSGWQYDTWLWEHDADYIKNFMKACYGGEKFVFVADDWGGGSLFHFASKYPNMLLNQIYIDPVALSGYPISEIAAIGRTSGLPDDQFQMLMGGFDQTVIQIYKNMVHNPHLVWNQYTYRWIQKPYVDVQYETKFSSNMLLKWNNIRNLADRAFVLGGPQLLPHHPQKNHLGVKYSRMTANSLILWSEFDKMMPEEQRHRLRYVMSLATGNKVKVETRQVPKASHFAGIDRPDFVAANIMDYLMMEHPVTLFPDVFLGYRETRIRKGDEKLVMEGLRNLMKL